MHASVRVAPSPGCRPPGAPSARAGRRSPLRGSWHTCPDTRGSWHTHPTPDPRSGPGNAIQPGRWGTMSAVQLAGDDRALDLRGALVDARGPHLAVQVLQQVA